MYYDRVSKNGFEIYRISVSNSSIAPVSLVMQQKHNATRAFDVDKVSRISYSVFHKCLVKLVFSLFLLFIFLFFVDVFLYSRVACVSRAYILSTRQSYDFFLKKSSLFTKNC